MSQYDKSDKCRMYLDEKPHRDDIVIVEVVSIEETFVNCKLLEYNDIEAMLSLRNIQRRRFRGKIPLRKKQIIYCKVLTEFEDKNIDVSKRDVTLEDIEIKKIDWIKSKFVHSLFKTVIMKFDLSLNEIYEKFGWELDLEDGERIYDKLSIFVDDPDLINDYDLDKEIKEVLLDTIKMKFKAKEREVRAIIELTCFTYHGIEGIKAALNKNKRDGIKMCVINCPLFSLSMKVLKVDKGMEEMNKIINKIGEDIKEYGGDMKIKDEPSVIERVGDNYLNS